MSRGFVKEPDDVSEPVVRDERRKRLVTRSGLIALTERLAASHDPAERRALELLVANAVVPPLPLDLAEVAFGATVTVAEARNRERSYIIVGEDEIDIAAGRIGVDSPLSEALLGRRAGDRVTWHRPSGDASLTIRSVAYDA